MFYNTFPSRCPFALSQYETAWSCHWIHSSPPGAEPWIYRCIVSGSLRISRRNFPEQGFWICLYHQGDWLGFVDVVLRIENQRCRRRRYRQTDIQHYCQWEQQPRRADDPSKFCDIPGWNIILICQYFLKSICIVKRNMYIYAILNYIFIFA